jgi:hypothetical protein
MARQSGFSKYAQGTQQLAFNLSEEADSIVQYCQRLKTASVARLFLGNTKTRSMGTVNIYSKVMSECCNGTGLMAVKQTTS